MNPREGREPSGPDTQPNTGSNLPATQRSSWLHKAVVRVYAITPRWISHQFVRMVKPTHPIGVVALVLDDANQVLILRHTYHDPPWRLPGGLLERGEQPFDTAVREVREEAGIDVRPLAVISSRLLLYSFDVVVLCVPVQTHPFCVNTEVSERRWQPVHDVAHLPQEHQEFVAQALKVRGCL